MKITKKILIIALMLSCYFLFENKSTAQSECPAMQICQNNAEQTYQNCLNNTNNQYNSCIWTASNQEINCLTQAQTRYENCQNDYVQAFWDWYDANNGDPMPPYRCEDQYNVATMMCSFNVQSAYNTCESNQENGETNCWNTRNQALGDCNNIQCP